MLYMSGSLGVNCTYCHNTRALARWDESTPQRVTAWHGIRMVRELNTDFLTPLDAASFRPTASGRTVTARRWVAPPATRARSSRSMASAR